MRHLFIVLLLSLIPCLPCTAYTPGELDPQTELFQRALSGCGLSLSDLRVNTADRALWGGDKYRLPFFDCLMDEPLKISPYVRRLTDQLLTNSGNAATVLISAQSRLNQGVRLGLVGDVLEPYQKRVQELGRVNLAVALAELERYAGKSDAKPEDYTGSSYDSLDAALRDNVALLLFVVPDVLEYRRLGLTEPIKSLGLDPQEVYDRVVKSTFADEQNDDIGGELETTLLIEHLLDKVDFPLLNTGATLLTLAVQRVFDNLAPRREELAAAAASYWRMTPLGLVIIGQASPSDGGAACLLSLGGNSAGRWLHASETTSYANPVSVGISLSGDSQYPPRMPVAAGIFGYGILADLAGNDHYGGEFGTQGFGLFGTGLLIDSGGDDTYAGVGMCQGCGNYGTGLLIDLGGNDRYECYQQGQGYGFTKGVGLLLDAAGDDVYVANDTDIRFPGPQTKEHNTSMSQGVGNGRRGDYLDGHSWAGGVGMLVDGGGDDAYSCGVFGQGCGYWYSTGILVDKGGNDKYLGQWYCQGACAHFALGILQDDGGDDAYTGMMNMCGGAGHDFSVGWLEDRAGSDSYAYPNLSLGAGNANGIGVFWDHAGDDRYLTKGITLGQASTAGSGSLRDFIMTLGVFVDGGGHDTYMESPAQEGAEPQPFSFCGDGQTWSRPGASSPALPGEHGCGKDAE